MHEDRCMALAYNRREGPFLNIRTRGSIIVVGSTVQGVRGVTVLLIYFQGLYITITDVYSHFMDPTDLCRHRKLLCTEVASQIAVETLSSHLLHRLTCVLSFMNPNTRYQALLNGIISRIYHCQHRTAHNWKGVIWVFWASVSLPSAHCDARLPSHVSTCSFLVIAAYIPSRARWILGHPVQYSIFSALSPPLKTMDVLIVSFIGCIVH